MAIVHLFSVECRRTCSYIWTYFRLIRVDVFHWFSYIIRIYAPNGGVYTVSTSGQSGDLENVVAECFPIGDLLFVDACATGSEYHHVSIAIRGAPKEIPAHMDGV